MGQGESISCEVIGPINSNEKTQSIEQINSVREKGDNHKIPITKQVCSHADKKNPLSKGEIGDPCSQINRENSKERRILMTKEK